MILRSAPWIAARPSEHRDDQHHAVDRQRQVGGDLRGQREGVGEVVGPARQQHQHRGAPHRADQRAQAAEHDRRQQRQRERSSKAPGRGELQDDREQAAAEPRASRRSPRTRASARARRAARTATPRSRRRAPRETSARSRCARGCSSRTPPPARRRPRSTPPSAPAGSSLPSHDGGVGRVDHQPVRAAERARVLVRQRRQADREGERGARQVGPAQARGAPRRRAARRAR